VEWQQGMVWSLEAFGQQLSFSYAQSQSQIRTSQVIGGMKSKKDIFLTSALAG
jgi:hypothetical protein